MQLPVLKQSGGPDPKRTVVPQIIRSTFDIAPRATLDLSSVPASRTVRAENSDMFKRLKQKMQTKTTKAKKEGGVSIQGGGR